MSEKSTKRSRNRVKNLETKIMKKIFWVKSGKPERLKRLREKIETEMKKLEKINKTKEIKKSKVKNICSKKKTCKVLEEPEIEKMNKTKNLREIEIKLIILIQ